MLYKFSKIFLFSSIFVSGSMFAIEEDIEKFSNPSESISSFEQEISNYDEFSYQNNLKNELTYDCVFVQEEISDDTFIEENNDESLIDVIDDLSNEDYPNSVEEVAIDEENPEYADETLIDEENYGYVNDDEFYTEELDQYYDEPSRIVYILIDQNKESSDQLINVIEEKVSNLIDGMYREFEIQRNTFAQYIQGIMQQFFVTPYQSMFNSFSNFSPFNIGRQFLNQFMMF